MSRMLLCVTLMMLVLSAGCDLMDPARPTSQPDTEVFGNLLEVERNDKDPNLWTVRIQVNPPRAIRSAEESSGKPTPAVEKGLSATVTVGPDTVVIADDEPSVLDDLSSGTEVVVIPVPGSTEMRGSQEVRLEASMIMDFNTYQQWQLPGLGASDQEEVNDPARINSTGPEISPVPLKSGRVLYFSARLRPPVTTDDDWHGAVRDGLEIPGEGAVLKERSYRTELSEDGWSSPQLVRFQGLDEMMRARVTWVDDDETSCLVTVQEQNQPSWVSLATRKNAHSDWSEPVRVDALGESAHDAVYLRGSHTKIVFISTGAGKDTDLYLFNPSIETPLGPLEPRISSFGNEWNPRTGPQNELFFVREDRQLVFAGGQVRALRLPGPHRVVFTRAAPTDDGQWLFFCMPKYRPVDLDENIYVARIEGDMALGDPIPVDDWRP